MPPLAPFADSSSIGFFSDHSRDSQNKPSVMFSLDQNQVQLIEKVEDMSPEDILNSYYRPDDFKKMKSKNRVLLRMMKAGRFNGNNSNEYCFRGIEDDATKEERRARISKVRSALFAELRQQKLNGVDEPEELAKKLAQESRVSLELALARGHSDAEDVREEKQKSLPAQTRPCGSSATTCTTGMQPCIQRVAV